jgi:ubiquinone/menaquinone biosynthesis C-methylase UbiE
MDASKINAYFENSSVADHYVQAASRVGLWRSEEKIFTRLFRPEQSILELGCGAGRIAIGLYELGYQNVLASDLSKEMVTRARHLAKMLEYAVPFRVCDATALEFEDAVFDGAIFGFNGLMQIPSGAGRESALNEVFRVLRPSAWFAFTTHDRERSLHRDFWQAEKARWARGQQGLDLECFGDRLEAAEEGIHFMHVPTVDEVQTLLEKVGFRIEASVMRSELCVEDEAVKEFSDDCRFWVVQRPGNS